jgi:hypothetical protein
MHEPGLATAQSRQQGAYGGDDIDIGRGRLIEGAPQQFEVGPVRAQQLFPRGASAAKSSTMGR